MGQRVYLNTWSRPVLEPAGEPTTAADYPTIAAVLDHVTDHDPAGRTWLEHWFAYKVQNPGALMKVAVSISTKPGGGKGTLAYAMQQMLGPDNCYVIEGSRLGNKFNVQWADKLFVLADEVKSAENTVDISQQLKTFIDSNTIEVEGKGENQRAQKNRTAWMFASNDRVSPVVVEHGDRRYTVFANHAELAPEYVAQLNTSFGPDRTTPTPAFLLELRAFYRYLLDLPADRDLVSRPHQNAHRQELITASQSSHDAFHEYVRDFGIDGLLAEVLLYDNGALTSTRAEWDFGAKGLATAVLYRCYTHWCRQSGHRPLKLVKFGVAMGKHWPKHRFVWADQRVNGYAVPRTPAQTQPSAIA